jgi:hypothetical protein
MVGDMTTPNERPSTMPGQIYTMLSRAKSMKGLKLCSFHEQKIKVNATALQEMERLKKNNQLQTETFHKNIHALPSLVVVTYLNIRSLKQYYPDLAADMMSEFSGFLCFSETNVSRYHTFPICDMKVISCSNKHHGTVIYSSYSDAEEVSFECSHLEVAATMYKGLLLAAIYTPPSSSFSDVSGDLKLLLNQVQCLSSQGLISKVAVVGDFNMSFQQMTSLQPVVESYGLSQVVSEPTHQLGSILDLLFTNIIDYNLANIPVWFSDHHAIILTFPI